MNSSMVQWRMSRDDCGHGCILQLRLARHTCSFLTCYASHTKLRTGSGVSVFVLASLAVHKGISTTQRYITVNDEVKRRAVELVRCFISFQVCRLADSWGSFPPFGRNSARLSLYPIDTFQRCSDSTRLRICQSLCCCTVLYTQRLLFPALCIQPEPKS